MIKTKLRVWSLPYHLFFFGMLLMSFSTTLQAQQIKVKIDQVPQSLDQLIALVEAQTDYRFVYNTSKITLNTSLQKAPTDTELVQLLDAIFSELPYRYTIKGKQVIILEQKPALQNQEQSRMITGTVHDTYGNPLPGATLTVVNTRKGVMTDAAGNFKYLVQAVALNAVQLEVNYLGMETQLVTLGSRSRLDIQMEEAQNELDQVVITSSYGTQKLKEEVVGSIVTVTDKEIPIEQASESIDKMLEGQVAGVLIENTSGVGEPVRIDIRGQGSLTPLNNPLLGTSTQPLIIIDGVIMTEETGIDNAFFDGGGVAGESFTNPLAKIAPGDIESINVLKDAAAVGIYGADGANGVIIITTKKGKRGKTRYSFSTQLGVSEAINQIQYLSGSQYTQLRNEFLRNTGGTLLLENGLNTNWFDLLNTTGVYTKYNLSASGASERFNYRASVTYLDIDEPQMGNENKQVNANINLGYDLGKLNFRLSLSPSYQQRTQPNIYYGYAFVPRLSPYNEDGSFALLGVNTVANPLAAIAQNRNDNTGYGLLGSFNINYQVIEGLKISSLFGLDYKDKEQDRYFSGANESGRGNGTFVLDGETYPRWGRRIINGRNSTRWNWQTQVFYEKQWGDHGFDILGGLELSEEKTDLDYASGTGFTNPDSINAVADAVQDDNLDTAVDERFSNQTYRADINNNSRVSFYGQVNYNYKGKYYFLANFRRDESSVFGSDSNVAYNGGAGLSWVLSKEDFLNDTAWLDFLRLRTSYGSTGNSRIGSYRALGLYNRRINSGYNGLTEATPSAAPNPQLSWERNIKYNAGLDINLFGRLQLTAEYYYDDIRDLITSRDIPSESGFSSLQLNAAQMYNTGLEFSARMQWVDSKKLKWNTSFNIATLKNEVTDLVGLGSDYSTAARALAQRIGYSTSAIWGLVWAGIDPATGRDMIRYNDQVYDLATYRSLYTEANWQPIGDSQPDAYGGFSTSFQFGNSLSLSVRGSYQIGGEYLADYQLISQYNFTTSRNLSVNAFDYWRGPGDTAALQPLVSNTNPIAANMSKYLYDATFIKLSNINLTYTIPVRTLKVPLDQLSVFLDVSNVAYWYKDKSPAGRNGIREFRFTYPQARTISLGVKTSF